jgi:hypothetical protein
MSKVIEHNRYRVRISQQTLNAMKVLMPSLRYNRSSVPFGTSYKGVDIEFRFISERYPEPVKLLIFDRSNTPGIKKYLLTYTDEQFAKMDIYDVLLAIDNQITNGLPYNLKGR